MHYRRRFLPIAAALCAAIALTACGAKEEAPAPAPAATPAPAAEAPPVKAGGGKSSEVSSEFVVVPVFYGTDRQSSNTNGQLEYGSGRGTAALGVCEVTIPKGHKMGELESPKWWHLEFQTDPSRDVVLRNVQELNADAFEAKLRSRVQRDPKRQTLVFVHGYNVTFEDAARRTGQMAYDLDFRGAAVFYSWPSRGKPGPLDYTADEDSAAWAAGDLRRFLAMIAAKSGATTIHLIAHSMGTRVMTSALREIASNGGSPRFHEVILAAPDIDADLFRREIAPAIADVSKRVTLYASDKDEALIVSQKVHKDHRAGQAGSGILIVKGIDTVDATSVDTGLVGHSYYGDSRSVLTDIYLLISNGLPPQDRNLQPATFNNFRYWAFKP